MDTSTAIGLCTAALIAEELEEVSIEADCVFADKGAFLLLQALLEEYCEAREPIKALRAEVGELASRH